ncbi:MFS transporter [Brevibacillus humidisoli]|uniref:MDR family MFS transporter n=1 Tax=Brevibacillus humidisoli TaxID=2895522 RepID=UPI001E47236C|nr:MFS transporter [Brevibacillus humidisoli]UFJ40009.1 MFS transporter [Brevibacillus humidisoli]
MRFRDLHPNIKIRIITRFLSVIVGTTIFPFMSIYFTEKLGQATAGVIMLSTVTTTVLISFYGGFLVDRIGRRKVIVSSQTVLVLAYAMMTVANSDWLDSAWLTFAMLLVQSIGTGLLFPAIDAMFIDVTNQENRRFVYSLNYWSLNLAMSIGALAGGFLFQTHRFELLLTLTGVHIFTLLVFILFISESGQMKKPAQDTKRAGWKELLHHYQLVARDRIFLCFCLAALLGSALLNQKLYYIAVRVQQEFGSQYLSVADLFSIEINGIKLVGIMQMENTLLVAIGMLWVTKWTKRFSDSLMLRTGTILYMVGFAIMGSNNMFWILLLAVLIVTLGELILTPVNQAVMADLVDEQSRGSYMAVYGLVAHGGRLFGASGILLGVLLPSWMMSVLYVLVGCIMLYLFHYVLKERQKKKTANVLQNESPVSV